MKNKKSYMNSKNVMSESFLDKVIQKLAPTLQSKAEQQYLKKKSKKLKKLETELQQSEDNLNAAVAKFENAFEETTGKKIKLDDLSIEDLIKKYK